MFFGFTGCLALLQTNANNGTLDNYFLFELENGGTSSGQFTDLTLTEATNTYTDAITDGIAAFSSLGLEFGLSSRAIPRTTR